MPDENSTAVVQRYLDSLTGESAAEPVVRPLLDRAFVRLQRLCGTLLYHDYPRLTHPPLNLQPDELLSACRRTPRKLVPQQPRCMRSMRRPFGVTTGSIF
jgi:RNA polymerase sigma-70 factor (ECF subfamily)